MSIDNSSEPRPEAAEGANIERREALIKLGRYTAYAAPVVLASVSSAHGQAPISGVPAPPTPTPAPPTPTPAPPSPTPAPPTPAPPSPSPAPT
jgi:hypothetical protein